MKSYSLNMIPSIKTDQVRGRVSKINQVREFVSKTINSNVLELQLIVSFK